MVDPLNRIALSAAERLAQEAKLPSLVPEVERQLEVGGSKQPVDRYEPITISLASLIVSVASLAWTIYTDLKNKTPRPEPEVIRRRIRVEIELPQDVSAPERDRVIAAVVAETLADRQD